MQFGAGQFLITTAAPGDQALLDAGRLGGDQALLDAGRLGRLVGEVCGRLGTPLKGRRSPAGGGGGHGLDAGLLILFSFPKFLPPLLLSGLPVSASG